jgi:FkbM family methyltransferase
MKSILLTGLYQLYLAIKKHLKRPLLLEDLAIKLITFLRKIPAIGNIQITSYTSVGQMTFRLFDMSDLKILFRPDYEKWVKYVLNIIKKGDTVIDVGAHIGFYTLEFARRVGPDGRVIAVEPDATNFMLLEHNVKLNNLTNVRLIRCALSNSDGTTSLSRKVGFSGMTRVMEEKKSEVLQDKVVCMKLDTLLGRLGIMKVDFIKIDVEGHELHVLKGASTVLEKNPSLKLIIEIHAHYMVNPSFIYSFMEEKGFSCFAIDEMHIFCSKNSSDIIPFIKLKKTS